MDPKIFVDRFMDCCAMLELQFPVFLFLIWGESMDDIFDDTRQNYVASSNVLFHLS